MVPRESSSRPIVDGRFLFVSIRHCEEGALPDEAILCSKVEIASGEKQERPRNDGNNGGMYAGQIERN